jgi:hypothetical protein
MIRIDMFDGAQPKRGDLVQTNCGNRRERTWFVIHARRVKRREESVPRYELHIVRWYDIEPEMRMKLFRSAERRGGQLVITFKRYPAKRKARTFEQYMGAR